VASSISQTANPLRTPRGHSSGLSLASLFAHLLAVRRPVLLEILNALDNQLDLIKQLHMRMEDAAGADQQDQ
jgi:hypothetical protein